MTRLADELDAAIAEAVKGLRGCGYSWAEIGSRLGITCQAAPQRWGNVASPAVPHDNDRRKVTVTPYPAQPGLVRLCAP